MKIPANHTSARSLKIPIMKKTILALAAGLTSFTGTAKAQGYTYTDLIDPLGMNFTIAKGISGSTVVGYYNDSEYTDNGFI
jgi:hypothetical protein